MRRFCVAILYVAILCLSPSNTWAFDVDGFKSGMSKAEVMDALEGWKFDNVEEPADKAQWSNINARDYKSSKRAYFFGFCNNRLHYLQKDINPSTRNFITLFDIFSNEHGKPNHYVSRDVDNRDSLSFRWSLKSEYIELRYTAFESNDQLYIFYSLNNNCPETKGSGFSREKE